MILRPIVCTSLAALVLAVSGCVSRVPEIRAGTDAALAAGLRPGEAISFREELPDDSIDVEAGDLATLSLPQLIRLTAQNNAEIQAAMARVRLAQAEAKQSRLLPNPVMTLALRLPESGTAIIVAGLSADLIALIKRPGATSAADSRLRAATAQAVIVVLDELTVAQEHFFTVQSLEATIAVLNERRELIDRLLALSESKLRMGEGTRLDMLSLQTQRVDLETEIAESELQLRDQRLALARLLGQPSSNVEWVVPKSSSMNAVVLDETVCLQIALAHRPEVQERQWELAALGDEQKLTEWGPWNSTEAGIAAERDGDWSAGPSVALPVPLFDFGQGQRDRAMARVIEARHQLTSARRQVIEEVRRAHATLLGTQRNLDRLASQLLPLQEARLKQAEAQFRAGQTDITGLLLAEHDLRSSRAKLIDLQRRDALARVRLERSVGGAGVLTAAATQPSSSTTQRTP